MAPIRGVQSDGAPGRRAPRPHPHLRLRGRGVDELHQPWACSRADQWRVRARRGKRGCDRDVLLPRRGDADAVRGCRRGPLRVASGGDHRVPRRVPCHAWLRTSGTRLRRPPGLALRGRPGRRFRLRGRGRLHPRRVRRPGPASCPGPVRGLVPRGIGEHADLHADPGRWGRRLAARLPRVRVGRARPVGRLVAPCARRAPPGRIAGRSRSWRGRPRPKRVAARDLPHVRVRPCDGPRNVGGHVRHQRVRAVPRRGRSAWARWSSSPASRHDRAVA